MRGVQDCRPRVTAVFMAGLAVAGLIALQGCGGGSGAGGGTSTTPTAAPSVTVSGTSQARVGATVQMTAMVANLSNTAVTWQVNGTTGGSTTTGTISAAGLYTAPVALPSPNTVTITAVSQASPTVSGSMTESVLNPLPTVSSATVIPNGTTYAITVNGTGFVSGSQIQVQGATVQTTVVSSTQLTANVSLTVGSSPTVSVAVVNPDPGGTISSAANAQVGATATPSVTVSGTSQARVGATVQMTATVANLSNNAVTWQVNGVAGGAAGTGTISASGLYTAPAALPNPNTVTITAVSQASPTVSGSMTESVLNPLPAVTSATVIPNGATYAITVNGTGFVTGSQIQVQNATVATTVVSSTQLTANVSLTIGSSSTTVPVAVVNPDPGSATSSAANAQIGATVTSAARLLDQATFGPTLTDIQHVQTVGLAGYLNEQFTATPTTLALIATTPPTACTNTTVPCLQSEWWQASLTAPDQLRQRVALAMAEMFVVSTNSVNARAVVAFQNTLVNDAFANFSTMMKDVSLSPAMGAYLNMLNSNKPGVVNGVSQIANENYSRELMQLFTMGLYLLNQDGTLQLDAQGNPIPSYTQDQVQAFARAYTGWTYATSTGGSATKFPNGTANYTMPMAAVESAHDMNAKILLGGTTLPAGQTAEQDLDGALGNIFNQSNVGPFVCKQLIQHLVTSTPSAGYVSRVAAVFANNGSNVRGDMKAVVTAILMDQEARAGDTNASADGGHLREPVLWMSAVMRGLGFTNNDVTAGNDVVANASYNTVSNYTSTLSEKTYASASVFNFFPPEYVIPGSTTNAPEFGIENTASAILRLSLANTIVFNKVSGFSVDLSATSTLGKMASNPGNLVDALGMLFMHGQMSSQMRTSIVNHITGLTDMGQRVRVATYLVITSSQYKIEH